jgi:hypothetical protein
MFDSAFAKIATGFSGSYGGPFHNACAKSAGSPVFDNGGDIVTAGIASQRTCKVQVDAVTDTMRRSESYQDKDVRLFVLTGSLDGALGTDETISIIDGPHIGEWMIATINQDPAAIGWECLGRKL